MLLYLKEEEKAATQEYWFEPKFTSCQDFIQNTVKWIADSKLHMDLVQTCEKDVTPMDSVSNVSVTGHRSSRPTSDTGPSSVRSE